MDEIKTSKNVIKSTAYSLTEDVIGILVRDPMAAIRLLKDLKDAPSSIRDAVFLEHFSIFLTNAVPNDAKERHDKNLNSLVELLAEYSPNETAGYNGDPEKLYEYAKRIIKIIDDCGTKEKSLYIANLSRAVYSGLIDTYKFFKFSHCILNLTQEDLIILQKRISKDIIEQDEEFIDDFRALGLMFEVAGGYQYTRRAYELVKFALDYEKAIDIPDSL